jgi:hypothetical protein
MKTERLLTADEFFLHRALTGVIPLIYIKGYRVDFKPRREGNEHMKILTGHDSQETAFVIEDYPYGFTLRCKRRIWVETKAGHGQRVVTQTTNPKKAGELWNKPKAGVYSAVVVLYIDPETGYVEHKEENGNGWIDRTETFFNFLGSEGFQQLDQRQAAIIINELATGRATKELAAKYNTGPYASDLIAGKPEEEKEKIKRDWAETANRIKGELKALRSEEVTA